ncbi:MAG: methyltransferase domain-containing protein [Acidobacteria bacterium]|nr:methyltransferase domain-containing protein [Acidobacteriota bacterium]
MSDWDAARYHRVSEPQRAWGLRVLDRLAPADGERILDVGCGTGRLMSQIHARVTSVQLTGMDRSAAMVAEAKRHAPPGVRLVQADATALPFATRFDAVFSTATFHWVPDHPLLFREIHRVLCSGGRLVSQAGGGPNLDRFYRRTATLTREPRFAHCFDGWRDPWTFAEVGDTRDRLLHAGFVDVEVWLESSPTTLPDGASYSEFIKTVCLRHQLDRVPPEHRGAFVQALTDRAANDQPAFTLDYWRLNIDARKE